jgi:hypothetical protein
MTAGDPKAAARVMPWLRALLPTALVPLAAEAAIRQHHHTIGKFKAIIEELHDINHIV